MSECVLYHNEEDTVKPREPVPHKIDRHGELKRNRALCLSCRIAIESKHVHDFVSCPCGKLSVDGGLEYAKRLYTGPYFDLNEYEPITADDLCVDD